MTNTEYTINANGIIQNPGKFEGEPAYAPYFHELMLEGADSETLYEGERPIAVFEVDDDDRAKFPQLVDVEILLLWESDQGFCETRELTKRQLEAYRAELENAEPTEPEEDDITTEDHEKFYQYGDLVLWRASNGAWYRRGRPISGPLSECIGHFGDDHRAAVRAYMDRVQFWPNCWFISDHGNAHLLDLSEGK